MTPASPLPNDDAASLDLASLASRYAAGTLDPTRVATALLGRIAAADDDAIWISRVPDAAFLARAAALTALDPTARATLPLYGIPFAVKDNIDAEGFDTTAACPDFAFRAEKNATAVERLLAAGAMLVGKTNLDQFATGLVGVRSPYGVPKNAFDPAYVPGGSSSGSAIAVARGLVSFALGTDTAGSGRVPAGFNNIVGLKPTRGLISAAGLVPACQSLDCISVFALTVEDAMAVLAAAAGPDAADPFSRPAPPMPASPHRPWRCAIPLPAQQEFHGDAAQEAAYRAALASIEALGGELVEVDFAAMFEAASLLYDGPWLAERVAGVGDFIVTHKGAALPVIEQIIGRATDAKASDLFRASYRMEAIRQATRRLFETIDLMAVPTSPTIYRLDEVAADPIGTNSRLGRYTNFVNLLDLCGIAVPAGMRPDGLPAGVTLLAPAFREAMLAEIAAPLHRRTGLPMGATGIPVPAPTPVDYGTGALVPLLVVGGHLSGQPLNRQLTDLGARFGAVVETAPAYRLFALPGQPARPGMLRAAEGGSAIEAEIWLLTPEALGRFIGLVPAPLTLGTVELADGRTVTGFLCEQVATAGAEEITRFGGWRAWLGYRGSAS
jgi:allophanate hydrolase